jgi:hypothetical protein
MIKAHNLTSLVLALCVLSACCDPYQPTFRPNYVIKVVPTAQGEVAVPPPCPSWSSEISDPFDEQPLPQYGCANARNLASMVERPEDLVQGRALGETRGVTQVGAIRRYDNNQPRGLITPDAEVSQVAATTATTAASSMTGDVTGSSSSSSSSSAATTAAAP